MARSYVHLASVGHETLNTGVNKPCMFLFSVHLLTSFPFRRLGVLFSMRWHYKGINKIDIISSNRGPMHVIWPLESICDVFRALRCTHSDITTKRSDRANPGSPGLRGPWPECRKKILAQESSA